jgi:hypothetical protein
VTTKKGVVVGERVFIQGIEELVKELVIGFVDKKDFVHMHMQMIY